MKNFLLLIICLNIFCSAFSQTTTENKPEKFDKVFTKVEQPAKFPGGEKGFENYLLRNLNVAPLAGFLNSPQTAKVKFIVSETGLVSNVSVVNADELHPEVVKEAIRFIKRGPKWQPAKQNGISVNYQVIQPVVFSAINS